MPSSSGFRTILRVLSNPTYAIYTGGIIVSLTGMLMQRVVSGWLIWQLTESAAWLGALAFADLFPTVLLGPIAGALADRWDRMRVVKATQALSFLLALALFLLTATGTITAALLLALTFMLGVVAAFNQPARLALTPALVPHADLASAVALASTVFNLARFLGPAAAGIVIALWGIPAGYAVSAASSVVFLTALAFVRIGATAAPSAREKRFFTDLAEGMRYTLSHNQIAVVLLLMLAGNVGARPLIELLPGFAAAVFGHGATGLAVLTSSAGAGAVLAGLWLSGRGDGRSLPQVILTSTLVVAVSAALFTATERLWLGSAILVMTGFAMASTGIAAETLIQISVAPEMRGRVLGIYALLFRGGPALGALLMGAAAEYVGLRLPVLAGAAIVLLVSVWARFRPGWTAGQLAATPDLALQPGVSTTKPQSNSGSSYERDKQ
jgi:predicted MFS family arabinose efflux permease